MSTMSRAKRLILDIDGWKLEVAPHGEGVTVAITTGDRGAATHYVRLNQEETERLREYFAPALPNGEL